MANLDWQMAFPEGYVEVLCRMHSDHNPLLLRCGGLTPARGQRPSHDVAWIMHDQYATVEEKSWNDEKGRPIQVLTKVKENFLIFNKEVFGSIVKKKGPLKLALEVSNTPLRGLIR